MSDGNTQRYHSCGQGTPRENIQGMVGCVSIATGNITDTLKAKGMWENSLFIWSVMLLLTLALNSAEWPSLQHLGIQFKPGCGRWSHGPVCVVYADGRRSADNGGPQFEAMNNYPL